MRYVIYVGLVFATIVVPAQATLVIATDHPSGTPLVVAPGATSSDLTAFVFDPAPASAVPADNLTAYQVRLTIVPQGGSLGTLTFATPTTGTATPPSNYVLAGANFGIAATNSGSGLFFFDFNFPFAGGVDVPDSPGKNLLAMTFSASMDAAGLFDIVALAGAVNTVWTDNGMPPSTREFNNVPLAGGPVVIGQVDVTAVIPEAGALASLALVGCVVVAWRVVKGFNNQRSTTVVEH
jgi:hypothetical protein